MTKCWVSQAPCSPADLFEFKQLLTEQAKLSPLDSTHLLEQIRLDVDNSINASMLDELHGGLYLTEQDYFYFDALQNTLFAEYLSCSAQVTFSGRAAYYVNPILQSLWRSLFNPDTSLFELNRGFSSQSVPFFCSSSQYKNLITPQQQRLLSELIQLPKQTQLDCFPISFSKSLEHAAEAINMHFKQAQVELELALQALRLEINPAVFKPNLSPLCTTSEQLVQNAKILASLCELYQNDKKSIPVDQLDKLAASLVNETELINLTKHRLNLIQGLEISYGLCRALCIKQSKDSLTSVNYWLASSLHCEFDSTLNFSSVCESQKRWHWFQVSFIVCILEQLGELDKKQRQQLLNLFEKKLALAPPIFPLSITAKSSSPTQQAQQNINPEKYNVFAIELNF
ncbi:hypothetical protein [Aliikangiella sp. IMCC44632]